MNSQNTRNRRVTEGEILSFLKEKYEKEYNIVRKFFSGKDKSSIIKVDLLDFVKTMASERRLLREEMRRNYKKSGISQSQIRKHYNYFLDVYQDVEYSNRIFQEAHAVKLAMEKVYVNYDFAREKVNYFFKRFVEDLIDQVKDFETLESAKILFEALVGYSKLFVKKN